MGEKKSSTDSKKLKALEWNDKMIIKRGEMDLKAIERARWRSMNEERRQALQDEKMAKAKETEDWLSKEYQQEDALARNLAALNRKEFCQLKEQQLLNQSPEIVDLQLQLKSAYTRKELSSQIELQKLMKAQEKCLKEALDVQLLKAEQLKEEGKKEEEHKKKIAYRQSLQDQIISKYREKEQQYRESLLERTLIEDAMRRVLEEDLLYEAEQAKRKAKCQKEIEAFKKAKALWLMKENEKIEEEERKIQEYYDRKDAEDKMKQRQLFCKEQELNRKKETIANHLIQTKSSSDDQESFLIQLNEEEERRKLERMACEQRAKAARERAELREAFVRQIEDRRMRLQMEKEKENEYNEMKHKEIEDAKMEVKEQAKRLKKVKAERMKCMQEELEERRVRREVTRQKDSEEQAILSRSDQEWRERLEAERARLLGEHATNLVGYLPKGTLSPEDLDFLPQHVRSFYSKTSTSDPASSKESSNAKSPPL